MDHSTRLSVFPPFRFAMMFHWLRLLILIAPATVLAAEPQKLDATQLALFEQHIRPVLVEHCYECHSQSAGKKEGGLLLDSRQGIRRGGDSGPAVQAAMPEHSLLLEALKYDTLQMPPAGKLDPQTIERFTQWIRNGAVDPRDETVVSQPNAKVDSSDNTAALDHWALQPLANVAPPTLEDATWCRDEIDTFILKSLHQAELPPAPQASRATWLRRVTFDLIGLPPTPDELHEFESDSRPDAEARVVERLLASPHYGERWGRYWLDLARYADSNGADENHGFPVAWRYRDYVVAAFNQDKPYDQFLIEQLAGDLLPAESEAQRRASFTARERWSV